MTTLSLCMIVRDEAHSLGACLEAVKEHVDEIVIVDTGSTDDTRKIAESFTDRVYDFPWNGSFADARNSSLSRATGDWILVLDADEQVMASGIKRLRERIGTTRKDAFFLVQRNYTDDSSLSGWVPLREPSPAGFRATGFVPNPVIRLFRNHRGIHFAGVVHEVVDESVARESCEILDVAIHHHWESKDIFEKQMRYLEIAERELRRRPSGRFHSIVAAIQANFRHDYSAALEHFRTAAELGYKRNSMLESAAVCHLRLSDFDGAYRVYRELLDAGYATVEVCSNLANLMVRRGEYESALELLNSALAGARDPAIVRKLKQCIDTTSHMMARRDEGNGG